MGMKQYRLLPALKASTEAWNLVWLVLQKRFHKGPNPPKHKNHMGSHQIGNQTQCKEGVVSAGRLPTPLDKLVCAARPESTCEYSNSKIS